MRQEAPGERQEDATERNASWVARRRAPTGSRFSLADPGVPPLAPPGALWLRRNRWLARRDHRLEAGEGLDEDRLGGPEGEADVMAEAGGPPRSALAGVHVEELAG